MRMQVDKTGSSYQACSIDDASSIRLIQTCDPAVPNQQIACPVDPGDRIDQSRAFD
jgi:hypothetical protein